MKHENDKVCESCAKMLLGAHPDIEYWFHRIKEQFPTVHCAYVFRGKEEQDRMVEEKASLLKWPNSKHNVMKDLKPYSHAMDLFSLLDNGEAEFRMGFYMQVAHFLEDNGAPIAWGGSLWKHFVDGPHFELKG